MRVRPVHARAPTAFKLRTVAQLSIVEDDRIVGVSALLWTASRSRTGRAACTRRTSSRESDCTILHDSSATVRTVRCSSRRRSREPKGSRTRGRRVEDRRPRQRLNRPAVRKPFPDRVTNTSGIIDYATLQNSSNETTPVGAPHIDANPIGKYDPYILINRRETSSDNAAKFFGPMSKSAAETARRRAARSHPTQIDRTSAAAAPSLHPGRTPTGEFRRPKKIVGL